jgi:hypothetical protein
MTAFFESESVAFNTRVGKRKALVFTPVQAMKIGRQRLEELYQSNPDKLSTVDNELVRQTRTNTELPEVIIFCQHNEKMGQGWELDEDLKNFEIEEIGYLIAREHLSLYRALIEEGVFLFIYSNWQGSALKALRDGHRQLHKDINDKPRQSPMDRLNSWILQHLVFFFPRDAAQVVHSVLPDHLPTIEHRAPRIGAMLHEMGIHSKNPRLSVN